MAQQPGQANQSARDGRGGDAREEDPFGRPTATDGALEGDSVRVPDASVMKRARELLEEIRRRAGDWRSAKRPIASGRPHAAAPSRCCNSARIPAASSRTYPATARHKKRHRPRASAHVT